ncbi:MAG: helix-turn-helix transcriptional regulator [Sphingobium sp.]
MITRIRDVRRAKGLTLEQVGARCDPPTTAQTIGRLETGTRTLSVKWLNRIANALDVPSAALVQLPGQDLLPVAALLGPEGARAPTRHLSLAVPTAGGDMIGLMVTGGVGDYRSGDELWCRRVGPEGFAGALNRDVLVPRPAGRFLFGRLIGKEEGRLLLLPPGSGSRQQIVTDPPWIAIAMQMVRKL